MRRAVSVLALLMIGVAIGGGLVAGKSILSHQLHNESIILNNKQSEFANEHDEFRVKWDFPVEMATGDSDSAVAISVAKKIVVLQAKNLKVYALNLSTGEVKWKVNPPKDSYPDRGIAHAPFIIEAAEQVMIWYHQKEDLVVGLDLDTGLTVWRSNKELFPSQVLFGGVSADGSMIQYQLLAQSPQNTYVQKYNLSSDATVHGGKVHQGDFVWNSTLIDLQLSFREYALNDEIAVAGGFLSGSGSGREPQGGFVMNETNGKFLCNYSYSFEPIAAGRFVIGYWSNVRENWDVLPNVLFDTFQRDNSSTTWCKRIKTAEEKVLRKFAFSQYMTERSAFIQQITVNNEPMRLSHYDILTGKETEYPNDELYRHLTPYPDLDPSNQRGKDEIVKFVVVNNASTIALVHTETGEMEWMVTIPHIGLETQVWYNSPLARIVYPIGGDLQFVRGPSSYNSNRPLYQGIFILKTPSKHVGSVVYHQYQKEIYNPQPAFDKGPFVVYYDIELKVLRALEANEHK